MTTRKRRWLLAALALLAVCGLAWALWPDRRVARAKALQNELFSKEARSLSPEARKQKWAELRGLRQGMSPAQKEELGAEMRKKRNAEMARYFKLPPREKEKYLDNIIKRHGDMMKKWKAKGAAGKGGLAKAGPGGLATKGPARDRSAKGRDDRRQKFLDRSTPAERAMFAQFRKEMSARRARLGLPPGRGGGRPGSPR